MNCFHVQMDCKLSNEGNDERFSEYICQTLASTLHGYTYKRTLLRRQSDKLYESLINAFSFVYEEEI
jgi:hypothetical protein